MLCQNCSSYFCVNMTALCMPEHPGDAHTSYCFRRRRRVYPCCEETITFSSSYSSRGCVSRQHEVAADSNSELSQLFAALFPAHYNTFREESLSKFEVKEGQNVLLLNQLNIGEATVASIKRKGSPETRRKGSPVTRRESGRLPSPKPQHEESDDCDDLLYRAFNLAKK